MTVDAIRPARPTQVRVAFWLQIGAAVLLLGIVGLAIAQAVHYDHEISRVAALVPDADPAEVSGERSSNVFGTLVIGVPALLLAAWLAATAVPALRGSNVARILVFVAGGGVLLLGVMQICGGALFLQFLFAFDNGDVTSDNGGGNGDVVVASDPFADSKFIDTLYSDTDTFTGVFFLTAAFSAFAVLLIIGAVVLLLALPPAHRYFVPRAAPPASAWPVHPGVGPVPVPYMVCPDPSAHFPPVAAAPATSDPA
jgi:hypothetical protein